jgi:TonB family protein
VRRLGGALVVALSCAHTPAEPQAPTAAQPSASAHLSTKGDQWATEVHDAVKTNWQPPGDIPNTELQALVTEVLIRVQADGTLEQPVLRKPSGNARFDEACMQAIVRTGKVSPPPAFMSTMATRGVIIEFDGRHMAPTR